MYIHKEDISHSNEGGQQDSYRRSRSRCLLLFKRINLAKTKTISDLLSVLFYNT